MLLQILFALLAGVLTIAAPCILPLLPVILGASVGQHSRQRPLLIVAGFVVSFAGASLLLSWILQSLGLSPAALRDLAVGLLAIFGLLMLWPKPFEQLTQRFSNITTRAGQIGSGNGNSSGLLLGLVLGIIWTPCAGPILGSILTLVATQGSTAKSTILLAAYALGAGIPMLVIAYGSQLITTKVRWLSQYSMRLQQIFGVLIIGLAVAMYFNFDVTVENALVAYCPAVGSAFEQNLTKLAGFGSGGAASDKIGSIPNLVNSQTQSPVADYGPADNNTAPMPNIDFKNYGPAPDFAGISNWINSQPLTIAGLKGKVVLVDFWTYSCINCIRTLPYVTKWYDTYKTQGLVVVGVHTPEFDFEKVTGNVQDAVKRFGINYPVAQDNSYQTWNAYQNEYWPAEYLIDQNGTIVYEHFGEGEYDKTEDAIRQLLAYKTAVKPDNGTDLSGIGSPEMYFEPSRLENLTPDQQPSAEPSAYTLTQNVALNNFALSGLWQFNQDHAELTKGPGVIRLHYRAKDVYMVAAANKPIKITVKLDGVTTSTVTVQASQLYDLVKSGSSGEHTIDIEIPDAGFQAFTFTFG